MKTKQLSSSHKAKMAEGRRQTRVVESYLRHLEQAASPKKRVSPKDLAAEVKKVEAELDAADGIDKLALLQRREDLQRLALEAEPEDDGGLEEQFIAVASAYGDRKGVSYSTWREFGVPKHVLEAAGIARTRRPNKKS